MTGHSRCQYSYTPYPKSVFYGQPQWGAGRPAPDPRSRGIRLEKGSDDVNGF
jgi:hypothetical protein